MMSRTQRSITIALWGLVVASLVGLLGLLAADRSGRAHAARSEATVLAALKENGIVEVAPDGTLVPATQRAADFKFPAPSFSLTDQDGKPFDASQLKGKVWTAMFFFSQCTGVCPSMTERIGALQKVTDDPRVHCVSFTADPARDNPARLKKYAQATKADESRWHLLTGDAAELKRVAFGFKLPFDQPTDHSSKILLVGPDGVVRGYYESQNTDEMFKLMNDVKALLAETSPATQPVAAR